MKSASEWRVELARDLAGIYAKNKGIVMICLGGSAARGISDEYSDLDIIVYWDSLDEEWIRSGPLSPMGMERTALLSLAPGTFLESYHVDGLKIDFGHATMEMWEEWVAPLLEDGDLEPGLLGMVGGFLHSIPLHGNELYAEWKDRLDGYSDSLALKVIGGNMAIFVKGYLTHQCLDRGDLLACQDGMCAMLKKMLNIAAALNGIFYSSAEPRWMEYYLGRMKLRPSELTHDNIRWMIRNPGPEAEAMLYRIVDRMLDLVSERFPELADKVEKKKDRLESFSVRPCMSRPDIRMPAD